MNNKQIGTAWEREVCDMLSANGFWVHFITPDARGAQPFDIIAVKNGFAMAIECKTLADSRRYFTVDRIEENQKLAFRKWQECGNAVAIIAVKHKNKCKIIFWDRLEKEGRVDLDEEGTYSRAVELGL